MKIRKQWIARIATIGLILSGISAAALAEYGAIAYGDGATSWAWARRTTPQLANKAALDNCMAGSKAKDCRLDFIVAMARANGGDAQGWGSSKKSLAEAKAQALKACKAKDCKVTFEMTEPGFFALAIPKNSEADRDLYGMAWGYADSDKADKAANEACRGQGEGDCKHVVSGVIPGHIKGTPSNDTPVAAKNCRPTSGVVQCTSQCVNGDCVVTYENGCRVSVHVSPKFDPFSKQWKYPTPSC